uniref:Mutator-like transposase domain-containing protein n=1 Tax=Acrobeloides nanus TaxID=290746 RepID=A0A914DJR9_9BILA
MAEDEFMEWENNANESDEVQEITEKKPIFVLVEIAQLEKLLQRCHECGRLPGGYRTGLPRNINWIQTGSNLTAHYRCSCKQKCSWSTQSYIDGTETRVGNVALVAAAHASSIGYADLSSMFNAAHIPIMKKRSFISLSHHFVFPTIEDKYYQMIADLKTSLNGPLSISLDGQYDSPGFSAELCAVTAIEETSKKVIGIACVNKKEVEGVSGRMELAGVKKVLESLERTHQLESITLDKHLQVVAFLKKEGYSYYFDPWHQLKSMKKEIKKNLKECKTEEEKEELKNLGRRFITHIYTVVERAHRETIKEEVFGFFLHVIGQHQWEAGRMKDIIPIGATNVGKKFSEHESFSTILRCQHQDRLTTQSPPLDPSSKAYRLVLSIACKTGFINDLERLKYGNFTSYVESFHSVAIHYRPKRIYFPPKGFEIRTMLAAIAFNENREAEERGERTIKEVYMTYSKSKGEMTRKCKKGPIVEAWKNEIVKKTIERKKNHGPGLPLSEDDMDDGIDLLVDHLEDVLNFDDMNDDEVLAEEFFVDDELNNLNI